MPRAPALTRFIAHRSTRLSLTHRSKSRAAPTWVAQRLFYLPSEHKSGTCVSPLLTCHPILSVLSLALLDDLIQTALISHITFDPSCLSFCSRGRQHARRRSTARARRARKTICQFNTEEVEPDLPQRSRRTCTSFDTDWWWWWRWYVASSMGWMSSGEKTMASWVCSRDLN